MSIFTKAEMARRFDVFKQAILKSSMDVAFLHSSDNVYYISGVPLLSAWGRPMWACVHQNGNATIVGAMIEKENMETYSSIEDIQTYNDEENVWKASIDLVTEFIMANPSKNNVIGIERSIIPLGVYEQLQSVFPKAQFVEVGDMIAEMRLIKSEEELDLLKLGGSISKIGANAFLDALRENTTELSVAASAVAEMDRALAALYPEGGTSSYAYCQAGEHSLTPHLHPTGRRIRRGEIVALNVFPVIWGYCTELERTLIFGEPSEKQFKALNAVNEAFDACKAAIGPNVKLNEIDRVGVEIIKKHGYEKYLRHGTGHAHGIMIGSAGREEYGEIRSYNTNIFRPNMATSVEPGIYISELGGFRHSDVMLVTEANATCITDFPLITFG